MSYTDELTHETLLSLLEYDPDTGVFIWKVDRKRLAKTGTIAGSINGSGYRQISVNGKLYLAHRLAWFYCFKEWPYNVIDHINGIRTDNRLDNLQDVTQNKNVRKASRKLSSSGLRNVQKVHNRYTASIKVNGKSIYLGVFDSGEDASACVDRYKKENNL